MRFGNSHSDAIGESLTQGASGCFNTGSEIVFRMPRGFTSPLAKML